MTFKQYYDVQEEGIKQKLGAAALAASLALGAAASPNQSQSFFKPGTYFNQQVQSGTKVTAENMFTQLAKHEGIKRTVYKDSKGIPTIGIGFNLSDKSNQQILAKLKITPDQIKKGLSNEQIKQLYKFSFDKALKDAKTFLPDFDSQPLNVQKAIVDMSFNLGLPKLQQFKKFKQYLQERNYKLAAREMLNSVWARQVGKRSTTLSGLVGSSR